MQQSCKRRDIRLPDNLTWILARKRKLCRTQLIATKSLSRCLRKFQKVEERSVWNLFCCFGQDSQSHWLMVCFDLPLPLMAFPSKLILCWFSPCHEFHILLDRARITKTNGNYRLCFCRTWFSSSLDKTWMSEANVNSELFTWQRRRNKAKVLKLISKIRMIL